VNNVNFEVEMLGCSGNLLTNRIHELHVNQFPASDSVVQKMTGVNHVNELDSKSFRFLSFNSTVHQ